MNVITWDSVLFNFVVEGLITGFHRALLQSITFFGRLNTLD